MPLLEVHDLRTVFHTEAGTVRAVDGVSFSVEPGRILGIVGESGCGKSVSALSVMRLVPDPPGRIAGGRIIWKDRDLLQLPPRQMPSIRGREISMIFQDPMTSLNPVFTVWRHLREVLWKRFGLKGEAARKRAFQALGEVGIPDPESRLAAYPHELSGGMKQRIMIALALLCEPDLLIADEPTTALDVTIQKQILFLMRELQKRTGMAIVLITHNLGVVAETCDDVVVMYAGKVAEEATVHSLFRRPTHPYTKGLLESLPHKGLTREKPLPMIEGTVPSLVDPPTGCRFAPRCFRAEERCTREEPELLTKTVGRKAACHFPLGEDEP